MADRTIITIFHTKVNTIDKLANFSLSSTIKIGNHVANNRSEGFGEQNGDRGLFESPVWLVNDSDGRDAETSKKGR
ncbi:hypothetical protein [Peribacillus kribbensis]|uniref:hypothetical protein n=1 Tax=Peribacillus kribbensis TaxID=356658 RepID=UPI0004156444|nr:hypothetical protein [Peribacillus kribbensis]